MQTFINKKKFDIRKGWKKRLFVYLSLLWPVIHLCAFWGYVNVGTVINSFFRENLNGETVFAGLDAYRRVFSVLFEGDISGISSLRSFLNSLSLMTGQITAGGRFSPTGSQWRGCSTALSRN